jgi:hypothetical protein
LTVGFRQHQDSLDLLKASAQRASEPMLIGTKNRRFISDGLPLDRRPKRVDPAPLDQRQAWREPLSDGTQIWKRRRRATPDG